MLTPFGPAIWIVDGPSLVAAAGFHYPTRMTVIRLRNGDLILWSPVALTGELRAAVEALGAVRYLVAPNSLHHLFLGDWQRACPEAKIYAPPGLRQKRPDLGFNGDLADGPIAAWAEEIDLALIRGNRITTEVVGFHRPSGTAIVTDLIQHFPAGWFTGWRALVARLDLMTAAEPTMPRKFRLAFTDRRAARAPVRQLLAWPTQRLVMAHGPPVTAAAPAILRRAFDWLVEER